MAGWLLASSRIVEASRGLEWHRWLGLAAAMAAVAAALATSEIDQLPGRRWRYRIALFWAAALVAVAGHFGAMLVWWSVIEPKRRRLPGELWKVPYIIGARLTGMFLGMAFIIMRSPAYPDFYGRTAPEHGWSALTDQQVAGAMMLGLDLIVMLFALAFFFYRSSQEHDRAERAAAVVS